MLKNLKNYLSRVLVLGFLLVPATINPSFAQVPGDACTAGEVDVFRRVAGPQIAGVGYFLVCDGTTWQEILVFSTSGGDIMFNSSGLAAAPVHVDGEVIILESGLACSATVEGGIRYNSAGTLHEYCNGTSWTAIGTGSGTESVTGEPAPVFSYILNDLTNVTVPTPSGGECLTWNGSAWVNGVCGTGVDSVIGEPAPAFSFFINDLGDAIYDGSSLFLGSGAGASDDTTTNQNVGVGFNALNATISGANNVAIGYQAGDLNTTGTDNILIGYNVDAPAATTSNYLNIGNLLYGDMAAGRVGIGKADPQTALDITGSLYHTGMIIDLSDRRMKNNIESLPSEITKINRLEPVSFTMRDDPKNATELGFIAQDVEEIYPELVMTLPNGTKALNYIGLISPLIKATQEQQKLIEELQAEINLLKEKRKRPQQLYNQ